MTEYEINKKSMSELIKTGEPIYIEAHVVKQWGFGEYQNEPNDGVYLKIGDYENIVILENVKILVPKKEISDD